MNNVLTKEEVLHVAHLARIELTEEEIMKYQKDLKVLFDSIDKIKDFEDFDKERMIAPWEKDTNINKDMSAVDKEELLLNVPKKKGNFVEVPVMVNE